MSHPIPLRSLTAALLLAFSASHAAEFPLFSAPADESAASTAVLPPADSDDPVARKIHAQLRAPAGSEAARLPESLADADSVLVEVRFRDDAGAERAGQALARTAAQVRNMLSADRYEAVLARSQLYELARDADVVSIVPARLARSLIGTVTSQGVAAGRVNLWQGNTPAFTGSGITIAMIDAFDDTNGEINSLQLAANNNWPPDSRVTFLNYKTLSSPAPAGCASNTFGCMGVSHGNATTEIAYDVAPGANFRVYDTVTVGDWRRAILDAANLNSSGGSAGAVRAQVISASLGAPLDGKGDGTALAGSIAEAAGWARNRGVIVVNAAGNERLQHWGGEFSLATTGSGFHSWSGGTTLYNAFGSGPATNQSYCIPAGTTIQVDLYWNAWTSPGSNRNYDLYLYRRTNATTWESLPVAQSTLLQGGGSGQTPQEQIVYSASGTSSGCAANSAVFGVAVVRVAGTPLTATNLQVFANIPLGISVPERSLGFPADSPNVVSVAAINVATAGTTPQENFSSEGPVLAAGGGIPTTSASTDPNLKPDLASFDNVSTVSYGVGGTNPPPATSFTGTSASTPHVAGMAALLMQRNGIPTTAATLDSLIVTPLRTLSGTGSNDLGTAGRDYKYGYGRLRFQQEASLAYVQQPGNTAVNASITPAVRARVLDNEGVLVPMGLLSALNIAIGNDPNGGSAVLSGGGSGVLVDGVATWNALKINLGGSGYTLRTSGGSLPASDSNAFNITTGAASKLTFAQQPVTTQAGVALPAITVRVEDSSGNLVTSDNATQVRLTRSDCTGAPVSGGGPVTVVNGIATFSNVVLYTVDGSQRLRALAPSRSSDDSNLFGITANSNRIFRGTFETCLP
ncbi:subtilase family protein [Tahibacter aquaticus]|uniref:Subtilase family protein n=1 Tax=Tahibacter aquaticus TaxID=520092 RepID=A0A4R6YPF3_9GAMM|nr:S8 family serine peptidase [Tahibacter aquaticus]TDR39622.1 subtilase family protein [Tahibacter aquaticus]